MARNLPPITGAENLPPSGREFFKRTSKLTESEFRKGSNIGTTQNPKYLRHASPDEKKALSAITARISELYKVTDEQIANAPPFTRAICWLTNNLDYDSDLKITSEAGMGRLPDAPPSHELLNDRSINSGKWY